MPPSADLTHPFTPSLAPVACKTKQGTPRLVRSLRWPSKKFGHVGGFLEYAAEELWSPQGRAVTVQGVWTPFFAQIGEAWALVASAASSVRSTKQVFDTRPARRRLGISLLLRLVERNGILGL